LAEIRISFGSASRQGQSGLFFNRAERFNSGSAGSATRLDFSYAVSSGNELDLDLADYIKFLVEDEHTKLIACLVERIRRPQPSWRQRDGAFETKADTSGEDWTQREPRRQRRAILERSQATIMCLMQSVENTASCASRTSNETGGAPGCDPPRTAD